MTRLDREQFEELLTAYLDGELDGPELALVEQTLRENASARKLLEELRLASALVASLPRHTAPESMADDIQQQIERGALLGPAPRPYSAKANSSRTLIIFATIAAMFAIMIPTGWYLAARSSQELAREQLALRDERTAAPTSPTSGAAALTKKEGQSDLNVASREKTTEAKRLENAALKSDRVASGDTATFEEKLARGDAPAILQQHDYSNEAILLQITVENERQRDALVANLTNQLKQDQFAALSEEASRKDNAAVSNQALYESGTPGVNFTNASNRQLLVRAPVGKIDNVFHQIESTRPKDDQVVLNVAGNSIQGVKPALENLKVANQLSNQMVQRDVVVATKEAASSPSQLAPSEEASDNSAGMLSGIFRIVGLDEHTSKELAKKMAENAARKASSSDGAEKAGAESNDSDDTASDKSEGALVDRAMNRATSNRRVASAEPKRSRAEEADSDRTQPVADAPPAQYAPPTEPTADSFVTFVIDIAVAKKDAPSPKPEEPKPHSPKSEEKKKN